MYDNYYIYITNGNENRYMHVYIACCNFKYICFKVCFQVCFQVCLLVIEGLYSYDTNNIIDRILHDIAIIAVNYYESYDYLYI